MAIEFVDRKTHRTTYTWADAPHVPRVGDHVWFDDLAHTVTHVHWLDARRIRCFVSKWRS